MKDTKERIRDEPKPIPRLSVHPLLDAAEEFLWDPFTKQGRPVDGHATQEAICQLLGCTNQVTRAIRAGRKTTMTVFEADTYAVRLGLHPAHIWGMDWWLAAAPYTEGCRRVGCDKLRYSSRLCRKHWEEAKAS